MESERPHPVDADALRGRTMPARCRTFPADRTAPRAATGWFRAAATGLSSSRLADAELCLDELVTNVVRYAWDAADPRPRSVTLRIDRAGADVEITVEDTGRPFDPTAAPIAPIAHSLDEAVPGGRGLMLVRSIAPRVAYERANGMNRTTIAFPAE